MYQAYTRAALGGTLILFIGCKSPYYADQGAVTGGLTGAGIGAIVGNALGETAGGAAIGAGVGALTGATIGDAMDQLAAENRAAIAAQMGRPVAAGAATIDEVVAMTHAGVDPRLMSTYVTRAGIAQPIRAADVIYLHQQGVPTEVIQAMQTPPAPPVHVASPPPPVIIEERHYHPPYFPPPHRHWGPGPRFGWGVSFSN